MAEVGPGPSPGSENGGKRLFLPLAVGKEPRSHHIHRRCRRCGIVGERGRVAGNS